VSVGKDQLPDLAVHVPMELVIVSNLHAEQGPDNETGPLNIIHRENETSKHKGDYAETFHGVCLLIKDILDHGEKMIGLYYLCLLKKVLFC
jgi:hypothetical protein